MGMSSAKKKRLHLRFRSDDVVAESSPAVEHATKQASNDGPRAFQGVITLRPGLPAVWSGKKEIRSPFNDEESAIIDQLGRALKDYRHAAKALLDGKYVGLRDVAPP